MAPSVLLLSPLRGSNVEDNDRYTLATSLAENEVLQNLPDISDDGGVESIVFAVELRLAFHASELDMRRGLTHY
jgi:hypothetical protein